ncbi:NAD+ kinase [Penicillium lagena]|uniref:NAD+ kinase n=1 Tax=Penicillium lagena TaxID=94218 RepID=UPI0025403F39|nr:NAD+ kinase [Penicillium lagena]KAJ5623783.1 NAD+ kinase [Penicillium lagena]
MHIHSIPMWTGKGNNYAYLVVDEPTKQSVIIDPANPPEVVPVLKSMIDQGEIQLTSIVNTHHHWDHAGGNNDMLKQFGKIPVIGGKECQSVTQTPQHGEEFKIGERISVKALHTPCHTQDSICYYMQDGSQRVVFTGDTLFIAGCGRFFEGNAAEMHKALNETLAALPDDTRVYPGHEYTKQNVKFCMTVSQTEPIQKLQAFAEKNQQTQGKFTIGDEKLHNVFMRVHDPEIQKATGKTQPVDVMTALREMKNAIQEQGPSLPTVDDSYGGLSDSDTQNHLEVVFYPDSNHRRKSSLVTMEKPRMRTHTDENDKTTACYVHSLIAGEWATPPHNLRDTENVVHEAQNEDEPVALVKPPLEEGARVSVTDVGDPRTLKPAPSIVQSRHLTKRQLSDMAWNVRTLSKKLGSIKLKLTVKNVFVVCKAHDESLVSLTRKLTRWLLSHERETPYIVYVEQRLQTHPDFGELQLLQEEPSAKGRLKYWDPQLAQSQPHLFDFVITLGGDGTVLYTSWLFQRIVPPVLSFALGSLGFLTNFDFADYQRTIETAFRDGVVVSLRLRFECTIMRSKARLKDPHSRELTSRDLVEELIGEEGEDTLTHTPDRVYEILNDVVLDRGPNPTMSQIELFGDDEHFTTLLADGICIATPTGSTAYNLAAGGSLSHPENPVILVTAICAHTLSFRPIILPDTIVLRMGVPYDARTSSWASFDGREKVELHPGDYVTVSASRYPFANVLPPGRRGDDWVHSISKTLNWNSRQKQKVFK